MLAKLSQRGIPAVGLKSSKNKENSFTKHSTGKNTANSQKKGLQKGKGK